jgi:hypothetical protein
VQKLYDTSKSGVVTFTMLPMEAEAEGDGAAA